MLDEEDIKHFKEAIAYIRSGSVSGIPYGSTYEVIYTATAGYSIGKTKDSGTFTGSVSLSMPGFSVIYKNLSIPAVSTGIASYTIKLTKGSLGTLPSGYTNGTASAAKTAATSISVPYGRLRVRFVLL